MVSGLWTFLNKNARFCSNIFIVCPTLSTKCFMCLIPLNSHHSLVIPILQRGDCSKLINLPTYTHNQDLNPDFYKPRVYLTLTLNSFRLYMMANVKLPNTVPDSSQTLRGSLNPKFDSYYGGYKSFLHKIKLYEQ